LRKLTRSWTRKDGTLVTKTYTYRRGTAKPANKDYKARFFRNIDRDETTGCWNWNKGTNERGYGRFKVGGKDELAHKWGYQFLVGEIEESVHLHHSCLNHRCVNPSHLVPLEPTRHVAQHLGHNVKLDFWSREELRKFSPPDLKDVLVKREL